MIGSAHKCWSSSNAVERGREKESTVMVWSNTMIDAPLMSIAVTSRIEGYAVLDREGAKKLCEDILTFLGETG